MEQLEQHIAELDESEIKAFRAWFERYDSEVWDRQIESDAKIDKLSRLAERALSDYQAGRSIELSGITPRLTSGRAIGSPI